MSYEKYCALIDAICQKFNLGDSKSMYSLCQLELNGVQFALKHGGPLDDDGIYVYCDFGQLPTTETVLVLERLLATNLAMYGNNTPNFGINPMTGHVSLMHRLPLSQTNLTILFSVMAQATIHMRAWRSNFFLHGSQAAG